MDDVISYYNSYDEDGRLFRDNIHKVEYLTSIHILDQYISSSSSILDVCAGTGRYSFYLAGNQHVVTACDIVPKHIDIIRSRMSSSPSIHDTYVLDARDLSVFADASFDVVLCMGAMYHLKDVNGRRQVVSECLRVLKEGGILFAAYINRQAAYLIELKREEILQREFLDDILSKGFYAGINSESFYFSSPQEMEAMISEFNVEKLCNAGVDGISYMVADKINSYSEADYQYWIENHIRYCTDPCLLGYSLHGLYVGRKSCDCTG